jgi:hypothetical protein
MLMQIVIDIEQELYEEILSRKYSKTRLEKAVAKGTPLPEKHGRLGDLDALEEYFRNVRKELKASDYKNGVEFFVRDEMLLNFQQFIHSCDAIIEGSDSE